MSKSAEQLRQHAQMIWKAGLEAVRAETLVASNLHVDDDTLVVGDIALPLTDIGRLVVVGGGKAGAGMATGVEQALGADVLQRLDVQGRINVPADCVRRPDRIELVAGRPAGVNEPTPEGVAATAAMLDDLKRLRPQDVCLALISGGGSALLPAPDPPITLADKQAITRHLSGAGANIEELNIVRKQLSRVKGGGLLRACGAGRLIALIISDVPGDPLDLIASGPTILNVSKPQEALTILDNYGAANAGIRSEVFDYLRTKSSTVPPANCRVTNLIIGNNATAVAAAGDEALRLGYSPAIVSATASEGPAEEVGAKLAEMALSMRSQPGPDCLVSGGEPVVKLIDAQYRGLGGRNQQLVASSLTALGDCAKIALLSGGTDGEDGPTDAAGAFIDSEIVTRIQSAGLDVKEFLRRNDTYHLFEPIGGLLITGPTHTNVCDLRVVVVDRSGPD